MKKVYAINCSPRKNWNTAKVLESALKGAADAGAETKLIHLVDLKFSGCVSCFVCKRKDRDSTGMCAFNDALTPVLEEICKGDGLIIGTPVYFGDGKPESLFVCDTYQFSDYSKFHAGRFDAGHKAEIQKTQFPQDCEKAYRLGAEIVKKS